jgi:ubiquinone/menaquinone biosynthesis C-methylase UbiE
MTERDPTFAKFTPEQGKAYAASRGREYPDILFGEVLAYHKEHGGKLSLAVDVGCGTGNATRGLAAYFDKVIGLDGSSGMIDAAHYVLPEDLQSKVTFAICPAERIAEDAGIGEGSVDLITSSVAVSS